MVASGEMDALGILASNHTAQNFTCIYDGNRIVDIAGEDEQVMRLTALCNIIFESCLIVFALFIYIYYILLLGMNTKLISLIYLLIAICLGSQIYLDTITFNKSQNIPGRVETCPDYFHFLWPHNFFFSLTCCSFIALSSIFMAIMHRATRNLRILHSLEMEDAIKNDRQTDLEVETMNSQAATKGNKEEQEMA